MGKLESNLTKLLSVSFVGEVINLSDCVCQPSTVGRNNQPRIAISSTNNNIKKKGCKAYSAEVGYKVVKESESFVLLETNVSVRDGYDDYGNSEGKIIEDKCRLVGV